MDDTTSEQKENQIKRFGPYSKSDIEKISNVLEKEGIDFSIQKKTPSVKHAPYQRRGFKGDFTVGWIKINMENIDKLPAELEKFGMVTEVYFPEDLGRRKKATSQKLKFTKKILFALIVLLYILGRLYSKRR